jgi:hypothetical protein
MSMNEGDNARVEHIEHRNGLVGTIRGTEVTMQKGVVGVLAGSNNASHVAGPVGAALAGNRLEVAAAGGAAFLAGNQITLTNGGGAVFAAGNQIALTNGGGALLLAPRARLSRSVVGVLLSSHTELDDQSRVLLGTPQAAALGAALGVVFALVSALVRRK